MFVTLLTSKKNPFSSLFGPADRGGRLSVTRGQLLDESLKTLALFPMDYTHPEVDWTGRIAIRVANRNDIDRALNAFRLYRGGYGYPAGYDEDLRRFRSLLESRAPGDLSAEVTIDPPLSADVDVVRQAA